jgi:HAD superfamily hydrolase (TIGR01549 family)
MKSVALRAVLLDMGGVLVPEAQTYERAVRDASLLAALQSLGIHEPAAFVVERARRVREAYRALEPQRTQPDLDEVLSDCAPHVRRLLLRAFRRQAATPAYDYARAVVAELARHYRLGLISNNALPGDHHARVLREAGILCHLRCAVWSANFGRRKPDPALVNHLLACLDVSPHQAILVGDKLRTDIAAAKAAGLRSVYIRRRGAPQASGSLRPDFTIGDLRALPPLLRGLG